MDTVENVSVLGPQSPEFSTEAHLGGDWVAEVLAASGVAGPGHAVGFGEGRGAVGVECDGPVFGVNDGVMFGA